MTPDQRKRGHIVQLSLPTGRTTPHAALTVTETDAPHPRGRGMRGVGGRAGQARWRRAISW